MQNDRSTRAGTVLQRSAGFSLVELALVLGIVALLISGIMLFFQNASDSSKVSDAMTEIVAIESAVGSLTAGESFDDTLDINAALIGSRLLPSKWIYGNAGAGFLVDPWKGFVDVQYVYINGGGGWMLTIQLFGVTKTACTQLVTADTGQIYTQTDVQVYQGPATPAEASAACAGSGGYVWYFVLLNQI